MSNLPAASSGFTGKRIALFLDGTWNTEGDNTNVWRLKSLCEKADAAGRPQVVFYDEGVGTRLLEQVRGGLLGTGLERNIMDAYQWLVEHYEQDDKVYIFGFSRGAFTARSLAGFITKCGILQPGAPLGVKELFLRYRTMTDDHMIRALEGLGADQLERQDRWVQNFSRIADIEMVAVWETVGSMGIPFGHIAGFSRESFGFLSTGLYQSHGHAYQAVAIDEHRPDFAPTLWTKHIYTPPHRMAPDRSLADVEQRWFVGAHANVGGGYASDPLAQVPLRWLMDKAIQHNLAFRTLADPDPEFLSEPVADSYAGFLGGAYHLLPGRTAPLIRCIGADPVVEGEKKIVTINETIDASVFRKWQLDENYRPSNLEDWARRRNVTLGAIDRAMDAMMGLPV